MNTMTRREFVYRSLLGGTLLTASGYLSGASLGKKNTAGGYLAQVKPGVLAWLESVRWPAEGYGRWKYNAHMLRDYGLTSSAKAISILDLLGELSTLSPTQKQQAIQFFQQAQDPTDGYIKDPLVQPADRVLEAHSWEHIWVHMNGAGVKALRLLGTTPLSLQSKPPFVDLGKVDPAEWILGLNWSGPWLVGEHVTRAVRWYWDQLPAEQQRTDHPVFERLFATYEQHIIDPATGMPTRRGKNVDAVNAMAGAFKVYFSYLITGRPIPYPERALDFVLALQRPDGSFGTESLHGQMTINWDAMWVLREVNAQLAGTHRKADLAAAGERMAEFLLKHHRKPDGGFSCTKAHCLHIHNSIRVSKQFPESDTLGTDMSLMCLQYADEWKA